MVSTSEQIAGLSNALPRAEDAFSEAISCDRSLDETRVGRFDRVKVVARGASSVTAPWQHDPGAAEVRGTRPLTHHLTWGGSARGVPRCVGFLGDKTVGFHAP